MANNAPDPTGPILSALFEAPSSDAIIDVVDRAGLHVDWSLSDQQAFSNNTRKREYRTRISAALAQVSESERIAILSRIAHFASERGIANPDVLNRELASIGWLSIEKDLVPLLQGPTTAEAMSLAPAGEAIAVIVTALEGGTLLDIFGSCPATKIAHSWIIEDLRRIGWA